MHPLRIARAQQMPQAPHVPGVIVGAGACGLTAAIRLRDEGIACVLLERDAVASGSAAQALGELQIGTCA